MTQITDALGAFTSALFDPADILEVRLLPAKQSTWFKAGKLCQQPHWQGQNVYVGVNPRRASGQKDAAGVLLARSLFVDIDNITVLDAQARRVAAGLPSPTVTISSGGGVHFYWRLSEPMTDLAQWTVRQKSMIDAMDSDPSIHDPPRIMRLPGTRNQKRGVDCALVESCPERVYALDQFPVSVVLSDISTASRIAGMAPKGAGGLSRQTLLFLLTGAPEGERNRALFSAACDHAGCGIPQDAADAALRSMAERCGLEADEIQQSLDSAYGKARSPARKTTAAAKGGAADSVGIDVGGRGSPPTFPATSEPSVAAPPHGGISTLRHALSNVVDDYLEVKRKGADGKPTTKTEHVTYYKPIETIACEILHATDGWPKLVGSVPFTVIGEGLDAQPNLLATPSALFAWMHQEMDVRWSMSGCQDRENRDPRTPPTKSELHDLFKQGGGGIERYRVVTNYPDRKSVV